MGDKSPCNTANGVCCHSGNCNKNGKCQACELTNGFCGGLQGCVEHNKSCGVNMGEPSTCEKDGSTFCFFDKDCGNNGPCTVNQPDHQHINKTCAELLQETSGVKGVQCNPGYKAAIADSSDGNGSYLTPKNKNSKRQPCQFVCNKTAPAPSPPPPPPPPKKKKKKKLSKSDIAFIIVGSVLGLSIIGVTIFMLVKLK